MNTEFREISRLVERLHRRLLDVVRADLTRAGIGNLSGVQALLLTNIGNEEIAVRDLIERGYYLGSNVSYNLRRLTEMGYLEQRQTPHDRRSVTVRTTDKAAYAISVLRDGESRNVRDYLTALDGQCELGIIRDALQKLERVWTDSLAGAPIHEDA